MTRLMSLAQRRQFFETLRDANPEPQTELVFRSNFELLVAVVLSAQATDVAVNRVTGPLFERAPDPAAMVALGEAEIANFIRTLGLFRNKASHVYALSAQLLANHQGEVPDDRSALEALPGVGRKTANVVLNTAFGHATMAVDTHIFRVANRTGLAPGATVLAVEKSLLQRVPAPFLRHGHHWLILHGRYCCQARRPRCRACPVHACCQYPDKGSYVQPE